MNRWIYLCLSLPWLFGCVSTTKQNHLSEDPIIDAIRVAKEFGIDEIQKIEIHHANPTCQRIIRVQGDEFVKEGKGQYEVLNVPIIEDEYSFSSNTFYHVFEFVEMELQGTETRIHIENISADSAHEVLTKFYSEPRAYSSDLNTKYQPPDGQIYKPTWLKYNKIRNEYILNLEGDHTILFATTNGQIMIMGYGICIY